MIKKLIVILFLGIAAVSFSGCLPDPSENKKDEGSYSNDAMKVEETQKRVQTSVPIPEIKSSTERLGISKRAVLFDDENKISYIYLIDYGKVMAFYTVKGKVSSLNSFLTPLDKLVFADGSPCIRNEKDYNGYSWEPCYVIQAPDIDGAYGENSNGVFFFTAEGAYVEWNRGYLVSDQPLKITTAVELVREIK